MQDINPQPGADPAAFAQAKAEIIAQLAVAHIERVEIDYDGEGDEGQIGYIAATDNNAAPVKLQQPLLLTLENFAWDVLMHYHGGFQNNDGGYGEIVIDATTKTVTLDHNDRYTAYENTVTEV